MDELFGERWLINGTISMFYTYATTHLEDVRAVVKAPPGRCWERNAVFPAWVETQEGKTVCKGTVSIGTPESSTYVRGLSFAPPGEMRIASRVAPGTEVERIDNFVFEEGEGGIVRSPQSMFHAMNTNYLRGQINQPAVGFYSATEVAMRNGPIRPGHPYTKTGRVVGVGASDKTEFAWVDTELREPDGRLVAEDAPPDPMDEGLFAALEHLSVRRRPEAAMHCGQPSPAGGGCQPKAPRVVSVRMSINHRTA